MLIPEFLQKLQTCLGLVSSVEKKPDVGQSFPSSDQCLPSPPASLMTQFLITFSFVFLTLLSMLAKSHFPNQTICYLRVDFTTGKNAVLGCTAVHVVSKPFSTHLIHSSWIQALAGQGWPHRTTDVDADVGEGEGLAWAHAAVWNQPWEPILLAELLLQTASPPQLYIYLLALLPINRKNSRNVWWFNFLNSSLCFKPSKSQCGQLKKATNLLPLRDGV